MLSLSELYHVMIIPIISDQLSLNFIYFHVMIMLILIGKLTLNLLTQYDDNAEFE